VIYLYIYMGGLLLTFLICVESEASDDNPVYGPCVLAALLWPLILPLTMMVGYTKWREKRYNARRLKDKGNHG